MQPDVRHYANLSARYTYVSKFTDNVRIWNYIELNVKYNL